MALQVSTEQRIFKTLDNTKKKGTRELKNCFLKNITELKIANFLLQFCQFSVTL